MQGQALLPVPITTSPWGQTPMPTSLWDAAWLAEWCPREAAGTTQAPMGATRLLPSHLHSHEGF